MLDKKSIIIIDQSHGWLTKYIKELGFDFIDSYINHGLLFRVIRELFFRLKLPGKTLFYNKKVICNNKVLFIGESLITSEYLKWLKKKCLNCRLILLYQNPVKYCVSPNKIPDSLCEKWTCDKDDAQKYRMKLYEGGGYFPQWKVYKTEPIYDVFYIGKDKNRLNKLRDLEKQFNDKNIKTMFYITWERGWQNKNDGIHKPFLPYESVLDYLGKTKAILHLLDGAQKGITIRIQEALIHKIKLITDDETIISYDFYNPNNIFILGKDNLDNLKQFLDSPYIEMHSSFFSHAYYEQMIEEIINQGKEK